MSLPQQQRPPVLAEIRIQLLANGDVNTHYSSRDRLMFLGLMEIAKQTIDRQLMPEAAPKTRLLIANGEVERNPKA